MSASCECEEIYLERLLKEEDVNLRSFHMKAGHAVDIQIRRRPRCLTPPSMTAFTRYPLGGSLGSIPHIAAWEKTWSRRSAIHGQRDCAQVQSLTCNGLGKNMEPAVGIEPTTC